MYNIMYMCMYVCAGGRVAVYGDSNCLDSAHMQRGTYIMYTVLHAHY